METIGTQVETNRESWKADILPVPTRRVGLRERLVSGTYEALRFISAVSAVSRSTRRRNALLILCYHGIAISDEHLWRPDLYLSADQFRDRIRILKEQRASVLALDDALDLLRAGCLPPNSVAITFDDGFYDFYKHAAPALSEAGYPSTLYLTTHYCNYDLPINNLIVDYLLWKSRHQSVQLPEFGILEPLPITTIPERLKAVLQIRERLELDRLSTVEKDEVAARLAHQLGVDYSGIIRSRMLQIMNPKEVVHASRDNVSIQLRTHRRRTPSTSS